MSSVSGGPAAATPSASVSAIATAAAALRPTTSANTIVWLGDSLTDNGGGPGNFSGNTNNLPRGFWDWAQSFLGYRINTLFNAGVPGQTSAQMLARIGTDVIARAPGWCHVLAGTNDVGTAVPLATFAANMTAIFDALEAAGIRVIVGTLPPRGTYTGSMLVDNNNFNEWIRDQGRRRKNLIVVDYNALLQSPNGTGNWFLAADVQVDGVHPTNIGAGKMGKLLAAVLSPFIAPNLAVPSSQVGGTNRLSANRFSVGGVGSVPTGWTAGGGLAATYAKVTRTDNVAGSWQSVVVANAGGGFLQSSSIASVVGDQFVGTVEYQASGLDQAAAANTQWLYLRLSAWNGSSYTNHAYDLFYPADNDNQPAFDRTGVLRTSPLLVPVGTTLLSLFIFIGGGGTYLFDRAAAYDLTVSGYSA